MTNGGDTRAAVSFLDPARKLVEETADWLLGSPVYSGHVRRTPSGGASLAHLAVAVPTAESGRRLRFALARRAAEKGLGGLLPPRIATPAVFLETDAATTASEALETATLAEILQTADLSCFPALFPRPPAERSLPWALDAAVALLDVAAVLGERALRMRDVVCAEEPERWRDLAALEARFDAALAAKGFVSRNAARRAVVSRGLTDAAIEAIVLPALVDAQPAFLDWARHAPASVAVHVLLHADVSERDKFDAWGRPIAPFAAPVDPRFVFPAPAPVAEADDVAAFFRAVAPGDALPALVACDADSFPALAGAFQNKFSEDELVLRNPAKTLVVQSALGRLLVAVLALARKDADYETVSAFLRSGDVARWLAAERALSPAAVAEATAALDAVQNAHLPLTFDDALSAARADLELPNAQTPERPNAPLAHLVAALERIRACSADPFAFLARLFSVRVLDERSAADRELAAAAEAVRDLRAETHAAAVGERWRLPLFAKLLQRCAYSLEPLADAVLAVDGWLETPWCDADEIVFAGFNEGCVPQNVVGHPFVPDSLRAALGLSTNDARACRDSFILAEALRCRAPGAVRLHLHQLGADKNVAKPSRILFGGISDADLPALALRLYAVTKGHDRAPAKALPPAWRLALPLPPPGRVERAALAPTRLDQYLRCPFEFFLRETFGEPVSDDARELDARAFGTFCHDALDRFAKTGPKDSVDADEIADWLERDVRAALRRFGGTLPAIVELQGEAVVERLRNFAPVQAARRREGWRIVAAEQTLSCRIKSAATAIRGKVDRIDENENTGALEIVDYKTWDSPAKIPASLQLPIYRALAETSPRWGARAAQARARYCILARRAEDVCFDDRVVYGPDEQSAAEDQVVDLLDAIAWGIFWPPAKENVWRERWGALVWNGTEEGLAPEWLEDQRRRREARAAAHGEDAP